MSYSIAFGMSEVMFVFMPEINKPHLGVGIPLPNVEFKVNTFD